MKIKLSSAISAFALYLIFCSNSYAQDSVVVRDLESWSSLSAEKSFFDKSLIIGLTQEFRLTDNSSYLNTYFTQFKVNYKFLDGFNVGLAYRFIRNNRDEDGYRNEHRFNTDLSYKHKIERLTLNYRFRYQNRNIIGLSRSEGDDAVNKFRFRLKLKYNIKDWKPDPYFSTELFHASTINRVNYIPAITEVNDVVGFEKIRFTLGTQFDVHEKIELGVFYRLEREFKSYPLFYNTPATYNILGFNINFKL